MPRRMPLSLPGIAWYILQRGKNRAVCFYAEEDYRRYLAELTQLATRFGCSVHAYAVMTTRHMRYVCDGIQAMSEISEGPQRATLLTGLGLGACRA